MCWSWSGWTGVVLMDTADDSSGWAADAIEAAMRGIAEVQPIWLGREEELRAQPWLGPCRRAADMVEMSELWEALAATRPTSSRS